MKFTRIIPAVFVTVSLLCGLSACGNRSGESQIKAAVALINATLPMDVDEFTRVDSVSVRDKDVVYNYTIDLGSYAHLFEDVNLEEVMREGVIENLREDTEMNVLKDLDVTFVFRYRDPEGNGLFEVAVPPALYTK